MPTMLAGFPSVRHVRRQVLAHLRLAADEAGPAQGDKLVDGHGFREVCPVVDVDVTAEHRPAPDRDPIAQIAVVGDVRPGHQKIVAPESGNAVLLLGGAVDRHTLVDCVLIADLHARGPAPVRCVLWVTSDSDERADGVGLTEGDKPQQTDVATQDRPPADRHLRADDAAGTNHDVAVNLRERIDTRRLCDHSHHGISPFFREGPPLEADRAS